MRFTPLCLYLQGALDGRLDLKYYVFRGFVLLFEVSKVFVDDAREESVEFLLGRRLDVAKSDGCRNVKSFVRCCHLMEFSSPLFRHIIHKCIRL